MKTAVMKTGAKRTLELLDQQVGKPLAEIETPAAVVDLDKLEANLSGLQAYCDEHGLALWPHTKTHKSPEIGLRQLELGAGGLTVAKTGEAQVFRDAGAPRILVHYPPFGQAKWERLADVAGDVELTVAVDSLVPGRGPLGRAAAPRRRRPTCSSRWTSACTARARRAPPAPSRSRRQLSRLPALTVVGISCYPGHFHGDFRDRPVRRERGAGGGARRVRRRGPVRPTASRAARRRRAS